MEKRYGEQQLNTAAEVEKVESCELRLNYNWHFRIVQANNELNTIIL